MCFLLISRQIHGSFSPGSPFALDPVGRRDFMSSFSVFLGTFSFFGLFASFCPFVSSWFTERGSSFRLVQRPFVESWEIFPFICSFIFPSAPTSFFVGGAASVDSFFMLPRESLVNSPDSFLSVVCETFFWECCFFFLSLYRFSLSSDRIFFFFLCFLLGSAVLICFQAFFRGDFFFFFQNKILLKEEPPIAAWPTGGGKTWWTSETLFGFSRQKDSSKKIMFHCF